MVKLMNFKNFISFLFRPAASAFKSCCPAHIVLFKLLFSLLRFIDWQMLNDFQNSFSIRLSSKREMKESLNIPPHLKCVATLPCKM